MSQHNRTAELEEDDIELFCSQGRHPSVGVPGGLLGYKRVGGFRRIFLGLKFSTPVFFWVEDLNVYFFGSEKSARIFWGSNFRQANSSYPIQAESRKKAAESRKAVCILFLKLHC